ncbi:MAG: hypothetical protein ABI999_13720, partial [Acidobacteriota bacterium]
GVSPFEEFRVEVLLVVIAHSGIKGNSERESQARPRLASFKTFSSVPTSPSTDLSLMFLIF